MENVTCLFFRRISTPVIPAEAGMTRRGIFFFSFFLHQFVELETGDRTSGVFGAFFLDGLLAFECDTETTTFAFFYVLPVYFSVKKIQKETSDNRETNNPNSETNEVEHRAVNSEQ